MATEGNLSFREVVQNDNNTLRWKEITIYSNSPDVSANVKYPELAGGYGYNESGRIGSPARNRFIYWRTHQDTLELVEVSLDYNLSGNSLRINFQGCSLIPGISIHESHGNVYILVPTAVSVHRLIFPHPNKLQKYEHRYTQSGEQRMASIFADVSVSKMQEPANSYSINSTSSNSSTSTSGTSTPASSVQCASSAAAWLNSEVEALFALATNSGSIIIVKMPRYGLTGLVSQYELRRSSMMQRLWMGLVPSALSRGSNEVAEDATLSMVLHTQQNTLGADTYVFAICRNHCLRMWSVKSHECVLEANLLDYLTDNQTNLIIAGAGHSVRKCVGSSAQSLHLAVHLHFTTTSQFCVFQPFMTDGRHQLHHIITVNGTQDNLIDYCLTPSYLWTVWNNANVETVIRTAPVALDGVTGKHEWYPALTEEEDLSEPLVMEGCSPKDVYMEHIFYPGRFSIETLLKALNFYKRSLDTSQLADSLIPIEALKAEVASVVDNEVESMVEYDMSEEDALQLQIGQWAKFYSRCVQYHQRRIKPLGIFADSNTGMVSIVKRGGTSYLRASHASEHLYLTSVDDCLPEQLYGLPHFADNDQLSQDVVNLCDCIKTVTQSLSAEVVTFIEQALYDGESPEQIATNVITDIMKAESGEGTNLAQELELSLQDVGDIVSAVDSLLLLLDLTQNESADQMEVEREDLAIDAGRQLSVSHLFSSSAAIKLVCETVHQLTGSRLDMARDLLLLLTIIQQQEIQIDIPYTVNNQLSTDLIPKTSQMVHAYCLLKWASRAVVQHPDTATIEHSQRQLESLEMSDMGAASTLHAASGLNMKLLELFLRGCGGQQVKELLSQQNLFDEDPCALWTQALMPTAITLMQKLWPLSSSFVLPEFLFSHCQYLLLLDYVHLSTWCKWNAASRKFMQGAALLNTDSVDPLLSCFVEAVKGVDQEDFLANLIQADDQEGQHLDVLYFLKVLKLLELFGLSDLVVSLAKTAISISNPEDPNIPTLWSKIFKQELQQGNNEDAYKAMISNPDASRRKDCLRQLLVVLCERKQIQTLVELPYKANDSEVDLEEEVVNILEARARSIDLHKHNYYDLLYSFHVHRLNYRRAGRAMYEQAMRLGMERDTSLRDLQKQANCYLAALNALTLVDPKYAWIIRPNAFGDNSKEQQKARQKTIKLKNGDTIPIPSSQCSVDVIELDEMEKEYMLVHARLQMLQVQPNPDHMTGPTAGPDETIGLLVNAGFFDSAIKIGRMFNLPLTPIFEGLATRCVNLSENSHAFMQGDNDYTAEAWNWLRHNNLPSTFGKETSSTDTAWHLLRCYLEQYEDPGLSRYHRAVATRLLSHDFNLPNWFVTSYKVLNAAELLRLYLNYDHLEEAATLTLEYVDAVLGKGQEHFALPSFLHCNASPVWLPYTCIDQLVAMLQQVGRTQPNMQELYSKLQQKLDHYFNTVEHISEDMNKVRQQQTSMLFAH